MALRMVALEARGVIFPCAACCVLPSAAAVAGSAFTLRERRGLGVEKPGICCDRFMSV